jgi:hypothetical protein
MSSWSTILALSGFRYDGAKASVVAVPQVAHADFQCFWSTGTGWGTFSTHQHAGVTVFAVKVLAGTLNCRSCEIAASGATATVESGGKTVENQVSRHEERIVVTFDETLRLAAKDEIRIEVHG